MAYIYRVRLFNKDLGEYNSTMITVPYPESFINKYKLKHGLNIAFVTAGMLGTYISPLGKSAPPSSNTTPGSLDIVDLSQGVSESISPLKGKKGQGMVLGETGQLPEELKIGKHNVLFCNWYHEKTGKTETLVNNMSISHIPNSTEVFIASDQPPESVNVHGLTSGVVFENYEDANSFLMLTRNKNKMADKINAFKNEQTIETITDKASQAMMLYLKIHQDNNIKINRKNIKFLEFYHSLMLHKDVKIRLLGIMGILQNTKDSQGLKEMIEKCLPPGFDTNELISKEVIRLIQEERTESTVTKEMIDSVLENMNNSIGSNSEKNLPFEKISNLYELIGKKPKEGEEYTLEMLKENDFSEDITRTVGQFEMSIEKYEKEGNKALLKHKPTKDMFSVYKQLMSSENPVNKMIALYGIINYKDPYENRKNRLSGDYWHNTLTSRVIKQYGVNVWHTPTPLKLLIEKKLGMEMATQVLDEISQINAQIASGQLDQEKALPQITKLMSSVDIRTDFTISEPKTKKQYIDLALKEPKKIISKKRMKPSDSLAYQFLDATSLIDYVNTIGSVRTSCYHMMIHDKDPIINLIGVLGILQDTKDKNSHASVQLREEMIQSIPDPLNTVEGLKHFISELIAEKNNDEKDKIMHIISTDLDFFNYKIANKWTSPKLFSTATTIEEVQKFITDLKKSGIFDHALLETVITPQTTLDTIAKQHIKEDISPASENIQITKQFKQEIEKGRHSEQGELKEQENAMFKNN